MPAAAPGAEFDLNVLESSDYLVDKGIEAAYDTDLGKKLKEIGAGAGSGAAFGASIGVAFLGVGAVPGAVIGAIGGALLVGIPWLLDLLNPCEFMVRGEGGVRCKDFPGRVEAAARFVQENQGLALSMTPAELASKFGIFLNRAEAEVGMGGDATPLMALPEAQELLRSVQVPMAAAMMTTVPMASFDSTLQALGHSFPAIKLDDVRAIARSIVSPSGFAFTTGRQLQAVKGKEDEWSQSKKWLVGTLTAVGAATAGLFGYAYSTNQPVRSVVKTLGRKTKRLFT